MGRAEARAERGKIDGSGPERGGSWGGELGRAGRRPAGEGGDGDGEELPVVEGIELERQVGDAGERKKEWPGKRKEKEKKERKRKEEGEGEEKGKGGKKKKEGVEGWICETPKTEEGGCKKAGGGKGKLPGKP